MDILGNVMMQLSSDLNSFLTYNKSGQELALAYLALNDESQKKVREKAFDYVRSVMAEELLNTSSFKNVK